MVLTGPQNRVGRLLLSEFSFNLFSFETLSWFRNFGFLSESPLAESRRRLYQKVEGAGALRRVREASILDEFSQAFILGTFSQAFRVSLLLLVQICIEYLVAFGQNCAQALFSKLFLGSFRTKV
jgi:hypothetical protein